MAQVATGRNYDAVVLAVQHEIFRDILAETYLKLIGNGSAPGVLVDVKGVLQEKVRPQHTAYRPPKPPTTHSIKT